MTHLGRGMLLFLLALPSARACDSQVDEKGGKKQAVAIQTTSIDIVLDGDLCKNLGIERAEVYKAIEQFFKERSTYKLSEFRNIEVANCAGKAFPLHKLCSSIDVTFRPSPEPSETRPPNGTKKP